MRRFFLTSVYHPSDGLNQSVKFHEAILYDTRVVHKILQMTSRNFVQRKAGETYYAYNERTIFLFSNGTKHYTKTLFMFSYSALYLGPSHTTGLFSY